MIGINKYVGGLGNNMFQIASALGIAKSRGTELITPQWKYSQYFRRSLPMGAITATIHREDGYGYSQPNIYGHANLSGYYQSPKYWDGYECMIADLFEFAPSFFAQVKEKFDFLTDEYKETISIHIRRGDYVGNSNYHQLGLEYYLKALSRIPNHNKKAILVFSDDLQAAKQICGDDKNVIYVSGGTDIEDLCMMTMCQYHIIANSSFSWWGAYLADSKQVIRPIKHFAGALAQRATTIDLYPKTWDAV